MEYLTQERRLLQQSACDFAVEEVLPIIAIRSTRLGSPAR